MFVFIYIHCGCKFLLFRFNKSDISDASIFRSAYEELESILEDLVADEVSVDELSKKIKRAKELVGYCKAKLRDVEADIQSVVSEEE